MINKKKKRKRKYNEPLVRCDYLEKIGISPLNFSQNLLKENMHEKRVGQWRQQRRKYGFDEREIWNLDISFFQWLYAHFKFYEQHLAGDFLRVNILKCYTYAKFNGGSEDMTYEKCLKFLLRDMRCCVKADVFPPSARKTRRFHRLMDALKETMGCWWI